jgi:hypothetical protein
MTSLARLTATQALRRAAMRAALAPSICDTRPWRLAVRGEALEIYPDWSRQLRVTDPRVR